MWALSIELSNSGFFIFTIVTKLRCQTNKELGGFLGNFEVSGKPENFLK